MDSGNTNNKSLLDQSITQGVDAIKGALFGKPIVFDIRRGWNSATAANDEAHQLEAAIDRDIGHSGASFGLALKSVFEETKKLGATLDYVDDQGIVRPLDPADVHLPPGTTKVVMTLT